MEQADKSILAYIARMRPDAIAEISGGEKYPSIKGVSEFYQLKDGVVIVTDVSGLPETETNIFAFHVHEGESCEGDFSQTKGHFNPENKSHPMHAGDMAPLFAFDGKAFSVFFTKRFSLGQVVGKTVVIHDERDDFSSQPSGNSGEKIACGVIKIVPRATLFSLFR